MIELTYRQKLAFRYIVQYWEKNDNIPKLREIQKHFGWASQSSAVQMMSVLIKKEYMDSYVSNGAKNSKFRFGPAGKPLAILAITENETNKQAL